MKRRDWTVAVALATCAIGLIACGGEASEGGGGSNSGKLSEAELEEGRIEMSECLREHGIDVPDPVPGGGDLMFKAGPGKEGGIDPEDPATEEAFEACEEEVEFQPPEPSPEQQEEMQESMLAFAQCMREHGVEMPDPQFEGGKVTMRIGGPDGPKLDEPAVEAAQKACQEELPGGGGFKAGP